MFCHANLSSVPLASPSDHALGSKGHSLPAEPICHLSFSPSEECELGAWGSWSSCTPNGKTCGSAWGLETRVREAGRAGQEEGATCQVLSESRKCPLRRPCPGGKDQARHAGPPWAGPGVTLSGLGTLVPQSIRVRLPEGHHRQGLHAG